jgi:hypothetical protein
MVAEVNTMILLDATTIAALGPCLAGLAAVIWALRRKN